MRDIIVSPEKKILRNFPMLAVRLAWLIFLPVSVRPVTAAEHKPCFRWVDGGATGPYKTLAYDHTLYDGEEPIGFFEKATLSFFEYKLLPGLVCGNPRNQTYGIGLYAQNQYWCGEALNVKELKVETSDPARFVMRAKIGQKHKSEKDDALDIDAMLEVTWDKALQCYAWTITKKMTILGGKVLGDPYIEFEDTYFQGHQNALDQRYTWFVRKSPGEKYYKMPLNNDKSTDKQKWYYAADGFWVACLNEKTNPALEWLEGHTADMNTGICWLYQDLHDYWLPKPGGFKVGDTKTIKYRFVNYPYEKAKAYLDKSIYRDLPGDVCKDFPMREWPLAKFDKNVYRVEKLGLYPWCPSTQWDEGLPKDYDPCCIWDKTTGYDDKFSLKIDANDGGIHTWRCTGVDYQPSMPIRGKSLFTFMVKTRDLKGYARLVYKNIHSSIAPLISESVSGSNDWTKVTIEVPDGYYRGGVSELYFEAKGPGTAWFDNLFRESEVTRRTGLEANPLGVKNENLWINFARASDLSHRMALNIWNSNENAWQMQSSAFVNGLGRLRDQSPALTFEPGQGRVQGELACLDIKMLSQKTKPDDLQIRVTLHKDAKSALFEVIASNVPEAKQTAVWGFHIQSHNTTYIVYYGLDNPERGGVWEAARFKSERVHFETIAGPAVVILPYPQEGWAMFEVFPEKTNSAALFIGGTGYMFSGESRWALIGGVTYKPGASLEEIRALIEKEAARDLGLYRKSL